MAALLQFNDHSSSLSSFNLQDFYSYCQQELDVFGYAGTDDGQVFDETCLTFSGEPEVGNGTIPAIKSGSQCRGGDEDDEAKRRKMDAEFRIGFRTKSEIEILDDGFKWRKYGKKAVKNSPNPRNYYRCASSGCGVKKRVERDRSDKRYVITTYEGTHNHKAPDTIGHPFFTFEMPNSSLLSSSSCGQTMPAAMTSSFTWSTDFKKKFQI